MTGIKANSLEEEIRNAFLEGRLEKLIGDALGKNAVMVILIDVIGRVLTIGSHAKDSPTCLRDQAMLRYIAELLDKNMHPMMQRAGKDFRDATTGD